MALRLTCSIAAMAFALLYGPTVLSAQPVEAETHTEKGSFTNPVRAGSITARPAAGSLSSGRPQAGSLTVGKPSAGSLSAGKPSAGSMATGVVGGSLSRPVGSSLGTSGNLAESRRRVVGDDDSTRTRSERKERPRRVRRRD